MANDIGDIELNNKRYRIDLGTWKEKDIIDFAPRATVPAGSVVMSDLNLYQPLVQRDWRHGFGFGWYSDGQGYMKTIGNIDTRQAGVAMMFTRSISSDLDNGNKEGFVTFNGKLYSWGLNGVRQYAGGGWSSIYGAGPVNTAMATTDYLFFCPTGGRLQKMDTSGNITNAGLDANATDYAWLVIYNGFIYAGKRGSNHVHYDTNVDLSQLQGNNTDPNIIYVGVGNSSTLGAIVYAGYLYVSRMDGLWNIGEDHVTRRVIDYSHEASTTNFRGLAVASGYLMFAIRDQVVQWNGARVSYITPNKITDLYPYVMFGQFDNLVSINNFLYCTGRTNETPYTESLLVYDGIGWHKLMDLDTDGVSQVTAIGYDVNNNYLWYHVQGVGVNTTYYIQFQNLSSFPYPNFPTTGQHSLISSRLDMGFRHVKKSMPSIIVEARNCSSKTYLQVYFQLDGSGVWTLWDTIQQNGIIELMTPGGFLTQEFNYALIRIDFVTSDPTNSPVLEGFTLRFIMRPNVLLGFNFWVIAESRYQSGQQQSERTASEIRADLLTVRNSKSPVKLVGIEGDTHYGYLTSFQGMPTYRIPKEDEIPDEIEWRFQCNFVEVLQPFGSEPLIQVVR